MHEVSNVDVLMVLKAGESGVLTRLCWCNSTSSHWRGKGSLVAMERVMYLLSVVLRAITV